MSSAWPIHTSKFALIQEAGKIPAVVGREPAAAIASVSEFPYPKHGTTLAAGISPGLNNPPPSNSTVLRFLDNNVADPQSSTVTIPVGTTLTWVNLTNNEPHTVTFPRPGHTPPPPWFQSRG